MNKKKVLICGYYGYCNLGDEAMLSGLLKLLNKIQPNLFPTVLSSNATRSKTLHSVNAINQGGNFIDKLLRLLGYIRSDYFILGGGDLLRDTAQTSIASSWLSALQKAIKFRCHTIVLGVSVGEIVRDETKKLIPELLNQVDYIGVRDVQSQLKLKNLGVQKAIHIVNDLALEALPENSLKNTAREQQQINIGIAVRRLDYRGPSVNPQIYSNIAREIAAFVDSWVETHQIKVHMLPFQASKTNQKLDNDDYASSIEIKNLSNYPEQFIVHQCFESVRDYTKVVEKLDFVIGMRLHALILSAGIGIPVIAIEYDPKVRYFMKEIGQMDYLISMDCLDRNYLLSMAETIVRNLPDVKRKVGEGVKLYRQNQNKSVEKLKDLLFN